ncbi:hypothetical protein GON03_04935 [Nocardioides sp. MAH-18]|uniref:Uncharacterized protein n=1 Tax=Nocardioides agri TaxID=2682843 RepID=A0A6L6XSB7_9ACTN|nr:MULTISPECIES: hypothetical protein [unclassified Nocardioides]MBA2953651.1 hypothetical protein [Nocardioides sp. CGMCC 1.13656]MVQ48515.1 hypothetical protein [Nocardioides sp. MAH-18]
MLSRILTRVVAAAVLAAAAYAGVPSAPAAAAGCGSAEGVTVVVDFKQLGGGVQSVCLPDGGDRYAAELFGDAGFPLTYVQRQPDFVCRVSGLPTPGQDPCVATPPANAYWSLWWTDEDGGDWTYSSLNAGGLRVPDGGYLAFSWSTGSRAVPPGFRAVAHAAPKPTPTPKPKPTPTKSPTTSPSPSATPTAPPTESASPTPEKQPKPKPKPTQTPSSSPVDSASAVAAPSGSPSTPSTPAAADPASDDEGLPAWVAPMLIGLLFTGAAAVAVVRRRRTTSAP